MISDQEPMYTFKEGTTRQQGKDARTNNINASIAISEAIKSTLGPKGMDKMLVDSMGDVVISNDGATLLDEMEVEHPSAKMMIEVAKSQDEAVGDGTTSAVILTGELLKATQTLLDKNIHPTLIAKGYKLAEKKAKKTLEKNAISIKQQDESYLQDLAKTAIASKGASSSEELLSRLAIQAVQHIIETKNGKASIDLDNIQIHKQDGASIEESTIIKGIILNKERVHGDMPTNVTNAKIALINTALEVKKTEIDSKIQIQDPIQLQSFLDEEESMLQHMIHTIKQTGATAVFCQKDIDDKAQQFLAREGIYAARRVSKSDMKKLVKATGGTLVGNIEDLTEDDLGTAGVIEERPSGDTTMTFITDCKHPKADAILLRGGTDHIVDELERAMHDTLSVVKVAIEQGKVSIGGGASAVSIAMALREYAPTVGGREQMAIEAYADAVESIPKTLASNAGLDPIDVLLEMRNAHSKGRKQIGVNILTGNVENMIDQHVFEPLDVVTQEIETATEAAIMILRIDEVIAIDTDEKEKNQQNP